MSVELPSLEARSVELALEIEQITAGSEGAAAVGACCWVLADLVCQARATGVTAEYAIGLVTMQLARCVEQLAALRPEIRS